MKKLLYNCKLNIHNTMVIISGLKYNFPAKLLTYLNIVNDAYTVSFIMNEVIRRCTIVDDYKYHYMVPVELYRILVSNPEYVGYSNVFLAKRNMVRYINSLKMEYIDKYISVTDVLSLNSVSKLIVVI